MKISVKRIAIIIGIILSIVFIYQLYWLKGLFNTIEDQISNDILKAIEVADLNELFIRVDSITNSNEDYSLSVQGDMDNLKDTTEDSGFHAIREEDNEIGVEQNANGEEAYEKIKNNAKTMELMASYLQRGMHQAIDPFLSIDINVVDSLLKLELASKKINGAFVVQQILLTNDSVMASSSSSEKTRTKSFVKFERVYDVDDEMAFRIWIENPQRIVLKQMAGILSTSIIIFGILLFVFYYLIKIIKRLQTEEELKTNFTNNMTHELKTPIAVSYAAVDALMVSDQPVSNERQTKYLTIAKEQMQHLTGLVEQILSMSRSDNRLIDLKPEQFNLTDMTASLIEKAKLISNKEVKFDMQLKENTAVADKLHLGNILNNLIENSIKYSETPVLITLSSEKIKEQLVIKVTDNGLGIDSKYQARIFDKFYRIPTGNRHNVKGYGLGLFYVKEMTERHGGTISVSSQLAKGTCFTLKLPQQ